MNEYKALLEVQFLIANSGSLNCEERTGTEGKVGVEDEFTWAEYIFSNPLDENENYVATFYAEVPDCLTEDDDPNSRMLFGILDKRGDFVDDGLGMDEFFKAVELLNERLEAGNE